MKEGNLFIQGDFNVMAGGGGAKMCEARKFVFLVFIFLILSALASVSAAKTIYVPDDYATIQQAVDNARDGDTIFVRNGTYRENIGIDKKYLTIEGENRDTTIIDGGGIGDCVYVSSADISISEFTIKNASNYGVYAYNSDLNINNATIKNCSRDAVHFYKGDSLILRDSILENCGGGVIYEYWADKDAIIERNIIRNNGGSGIDIYLYGRGDDAFIEDNIIKNNTGNGIKCKGLTTISSAKIINNTVSCGGNGVYLDDVRRANINGLIIEHAGGYGVYAPECDLSIYNSTIKNCDKDAIHFRSGKSLILRDSILENCGGGLIYEYWADKDAIIERNIIRNNGGSGIDIYLYGRGDDAFIEDNIIKNNTGNGIKCKGLYTISAKIKNNTVRNNRDDGIYLSKARYSTIENNTISSNNHGILLYNSYKSLIFHNNLINNSKNAYDSDPESNDWHHTVLLEGNYWSDYTGVDDGSGTGKHAIAGDGIGDTEIPHLGPDYDYYPFVNEGLWRPELNITKAYTDKTAYGLNETVTIYCVVQNETEANISIDNVSANIMKPDNSTEGITLSEGLIGNYKGTFRNTSLFGTYNVTIYANKFGVNDTANLSFEVLPEHDIAVINVDVIGFIEVNSTIIVNATIRNIGLKNESDITVDFIVDGVNQSNKTISSLASKSSTNVSFKWTAPGVAGMHNITVYAEPVANEGIVWNNKMNKSMYVREKLKKFVGVCYGPYRENEASGFYPTIEEMREDIYFLKNLTDSIRTYSMEGNLTEIPGICEEAGLDCYPCAWISKNKKINEKEIQELIWVVNQNMSHVKGLIVGNEVLLRGDLTEDELIEYIKEVKNNTNLPVTTAETWNVWESHPGLVENVDFIVAHIFPYWEGKYINNSAEYVVERWEYLNETFGKDVIIGETGWPSGGYAEGLAVPSEENQMLFLSEFKRLTEERGIKYFYFEAFDEKRKILEEGKVGEHWGIYYSNGSIKPLLKELVPEEVRGGFKREPRDRRPAMPCFVYKDAYSPENRFISSGWMGDLENWHGDPQEVIDEACSDNPQSGDTCIRIKYTPGGEGWGGIYWQFPKNNWGDLPGYNLSGALKVVFWARGENGTEKAEFETGGIKVWGKKFKDSFGPVTTDPPVIELTKEWKEYNISLGEEDLSMVIGGFCWVTNRDQNPKGCTIYLDNISFVAPTPIPVQENQPPTAIIDSIIPDPAEQEKDIVSFTGHGTDSDGSVVAYNWRSSIDGLLSTFSSFIKPASDISVGTHTIYFKVQDDDGAWSTADTEDSTIEPPVNVTHEEKAYLHLYEVMDKYNEFFDVYTDRDAAGNHYIPSGWMGDWDDVTFNDSYTTNPHSGANCIKITYSADFYVNNHYIPSGWMGDWDDVTFNDSYTTDPHSGANCIKITYSANGSQGYNWSGIYWQDPENNWGDKVGGFNLTGATELTFWAKGERGGERIEFKVGGINRHAYNVYTDKNAANNHYFPSGWYNGATNMLFDDNWMENPHSGTSCIKVTWNGAAGNDGWKWNGVMWQNPENNWIGDSGYGYNLTGATKLTFWARTDEPGLKVKFLMGYPDDTSGEVLINETTGGWVELYTNWTEYEINLSGRNLSDIAGGFAFLFNDVNDPDPDGCTFYLDDIKYDKVTLYDPDNPYQDSCGPVSSGIITLTNNWTRYAINLSNENLSHIIGGFCWVANKDNNPDGCTFYLDDIKYEYKVNKSFNVYTDAQQNWAGIYWQDPENNWGDCSAGGYNLTGATNLSFWAKGANGTEKIEFKIGGIGWDPKTDQQIALFSDSLHPALSTGVIYLTTEWKQYTIDLTGKNLSRVIGGFCWVTNTTLNPNGCTFYLDDIRYNKQRLDDLRFLASYETTSASEDKYIKNVAFTYDNALAMLAFMARGSEEDRRRAKILGDSFIYCQNHDRYFNDGRLRNAYQAGDIADYQGKARLPGWWNDSEQRWDEDRYCVGTHTGNVAWTMIALLCYYENTGNTTYLESAKRLGDWIYNNTYDTRYYGGYTGGYEGWGANQTKLSWKSTEHNLDVYVAFMKLYRATNDSVWQSRAIHAKNFVRSMWNEDDGHFWTGTFKKDDETINKEVLPADVNTWGLMVLGKEYGAGVKWVEDNCNVTPCPEGCGFKGFDFNTDKDGVWFEGTAHMCIAYQIMNETNKSDEYISEIRKAQTSANNTNGKGIVAACHDGITTGWLVYNNRLHVGATSWYIFAERKYNPYWQINTSDLIPYLFFDAGPGTYPSISGMHNGTIKLNQIIAVSKLYTYPCEGTGGHTEYARIYNETWSIETLPWKGYGEDWYNLSFPEPFMLYPNTEYNFTIRTGSYPQIHHNRTLQTQNGWLNCTSFEDVNGKKYDDWIPAIRLS